MRESTRRERHVTSDEMRCHSQRIAAATAARSAAAACGAPVPPPPSSDDIVDDASGAVGAGVTGAIGRCGRTGADVGAALVSSDARPANAWSAVRGGRGGAIVPPGRGDSSRLRGEPGGPIGGRAGTHHRPGGWGGGPRRGPGHLRRRRRRQERSGLRRNEGARGEVGRGDRRGPSRPERQEQDPRRARLLVSVAPRPGRSAPRPARRPEPPPGRPPAPPPARRTRRLLDHGRHDAARRPASRPARPRASRGASTACTTGSVTGATASVTGVHGLLHRLRHPAEESAVGTVEEPGGIGLRGSQQGREQDIREHGERSHDADAEQTAEAPPWCCVGRDHKSCVGSARIRTRIGRAGRLPRLGHPGKRRATWQLLAAQN